MTKQDSCRYLEEVVIIAAAAGRRILEVYDRSYAVSDKKDGSPLTEADSLAHALIVERLGRMSPDIPT